MRDTHDLFFASLIGAFGLLAIHGVAQITVAPWVAHTPALARVVEHVAVLMS